MPIISYPGFSDRGEHMNVETSLIWQLACFSLCGVFLGVGYEILRVIRTVIPHHSFTVGVEDTFYLALCGLVLFGLSMETGNGNFRASYLLFAALGFIAYFLTVGRLIKLVYTTVINTVKKLLKFIIKKLLRPVSKVFVSFAHKAVQPFVDFYKNLNEKIKSRRADLKKHREMIYNNDNNLERNEVANVSGIEGKVRKIQ